MSYLLDTDVISELVRSKPDKNVVRWIDSLPSDAFFLSVLSLGEIRKGIDTAGADDRRERLIDWLEHDLIVWFAERILHIDAPVADRWGILNGQAKQSLPTVNSLLAATALAHDLILATRNVDDFSFPELQVYNPWDKS